MKPLAGDVLERGPKSVVQAMDYSPGRHVGQQASVSLGNWNYIRFTSIFESKFVSKFRTDYISPLEMVLSIYEKY